MHSDLIEKNIVEFKENKINENTTEVVTIINKQVKNNRSHIISTNTVSIQT